MQQGNRLHRLTSRLSSSHPLQQDPDHSLIHWPPAKSSAEILQTGHAIPHCLISAFGSNLTSGSTPGHSVCYPARPQDPTAICCMVACLRSSVETPLAVLVVDSLFVNIVLLILSERCISTVERTRKRRRRRECAILGSTRVCIAAPRKTSDWLEFQGCGFNLRIRAAMGCDALDRTLPHFSMLRRKRGFTSPDTVAGDRTRSCR